MNYEETIKKLEEIVEKLNGENVGIEESLALYSEGIELAKKGLRDLSKFKGKIELLNKDLSALDAPLESDDDDE